MKIIRTADYEEMSMKAGELIFKKIRSNPRSTLGLATGSTPLGVYRYLIKDHHTNKTSYKEIQTFNLDEYIGINKDDPNSYHYFMQKNFFNHVDISFKNTHIPSGNASNGEQECNRYEELVKDKGGIDLQLLGIGQNGHIGFNEPGTSFSSRTHIIKLAQNTREANSRFFPSIDDVPTHAITMGIATIIESREILLLASGASKAEAVAALIKGEITENFPASVLQLHENVTLIADEAALRLIAY